MDIQSFIQSGLLEAYVLGQCSAEERVKVERMAAEHLEVRAELDAIQVSLEGYATAHAVQPPDWMKSSILERLTQEPPGQTPPDVPAPGASKSPLRLFQILAFLFAATCAFLFLRQKDMGAENQEFKIKNDGLQKELATCNQEVQKPNPIAELLCDSATQRILVSDGKGISTIVYYNALLKRMAYDPYNIPTPTNPGSHYQFWAIVGGKPVSMGMKASNICESLRSVENAVAFAISEEDKPEGNPAPSKVLAIGNAS